MIDVAFTRHEARAAEVTVVIDVLRATSTIVQAFDSGYEAVICADGIARARALQGHERILAGERKCARPAGFELGNSPRETIPALGRELVLATTNGAPTVVRAAELSPVVLIASLLNLDAVCAELGPGDIQLLCSGTDDRPALEDVYVAGRIAERLAGPSTDAAIVARSVAGSFTGSRAALAASADARSLAALGLDDDIVWCARESVVQLVPRVESVHTAGRQRHARISLRGRRAGGPAASGAEPVAVKTIDTILTVEQNI